MILTLDNIKKAMDFRHNGNPIFRIQKKLDQNELASIIDKILQENDVEQSKYCDEHPVEDGDEFKGRIDEIFTTGANNATMNVGMMLFFMLGGYLRLIIAAPDSSVMSKGWINRCPTTKIKQFAKDLKHMKYLPNASDNSHFVNDKKKEISQEAYSLIEYIIRMNCYLINKYCDDDSRNRLRELLREFSESIEEDEENVRINERRIRSINREYVTSLSRILRSPTRIPETRREDFSRSLAEGLTWLLIASILRDELSTLENELENAANRPEIVQTEDIISVTKNELENAANRSEIIQTEDKSAKLNVPKACEHNKEDSDALPEKTGNAMEQLVEQDMPAGDFPKTGNLSPSMNQYNNQSKLTEGQSGGKHEENRRELMNYIEGLIRGKATVTVIVISAVLLLSVGVLFFERSMKNEVLPTTPTPEAGAQTPTPTPTETPTPTPTETPTLPPPSDGESTEDSASQRGAGSTADTSSEPVVVTYNTHLQTKQAAVSYLQNAVREECPVATYETDHPNVENVSYTYESAIAAIALMSEGKNEDAYKILDAFVKGINRDQEYKDRFRNAYMAGDASKLPGYWNKDAKMWYQDAYQVGTGVRSSAAAACALVLGYQKSGDEMYLQVASTGVDWVLKNCTDGNPGYTAGYTGWLNTDDHTILSYKSTADNLWLLKACEMLADAKGQDDSKYEEYKEAAGKCRKFIKENMYSDAAGFFFSGTMEDGTTPFASLIVSEVQAFAELFIGERFGMDKIDRCMAEDGGYSYDNAYTDGSWLEGTAIVALAQKKAGDVEAAENAIDAMEKFQLASGAFPQASIPVLETGEEGRTLKNLPSVGACAWYVLAVNGSDFFELSGE